MGILTPSLLRISCFRPDALKLPPRIIRIPMMEAPKETMEGIRWLPENAKRQGPNPCMNPQNLNDEGKERSSIDPPCDRCETKRSPGTIGIRQKKRNGEVSAGRRKNATLKPGL